ncbi:hypothetical protein BWI96_15010 [Siphonobacter sp. SORGH_AS_0500]|nr:hypothetical protein BWI96_15010 [Siphonobacter sp. SORGH_AS_0500]
MPSLLKKIFKQVPKEYLNDFEKHRQYLIRNRIYLLTWAAAAYFIELIILNFLAYHNGSTYDDGIDGYLIYSQFLILLCIISAIYTLSNWPKDGQLLAGKTRYVYYFNLIITCSYLFIRSLLVYQARQSIVFYIVSLITCQVIFFTDWKPRLIISLIGVTSMVLMVHSIPLDNSGEQIIRMFECTGMTVMLFIASTHFYNIEVQSFLHLHVINQQNSKLSTYTKLLEKEKEQREEELEQRSRELTSYTLQEVKSSRFLEEIRQTILQEKAGDVRKIPQLITNHLHGEAKWSYFKDVFENVHPDFFNRITAQFPSLNPNDIRLMALLKMNLSTKEIADILGISPQSANTARYRLRKRLNLKPEDELETLIRNL